MLVLAFIFAPWLAWWRARREGLDGDVILDMGFWIFVAGLVGARDVLLHRILGTDIHNLWEAFQYWRGGIVYYGGIVGGMIGFFAYRWFYPFPLRPVPRCHRPVDRAGHVLRPARLLPQRCCYGDQCRLPWAVSFPADRRRGGIRSGPG